MKKTAILIMLITMLSKLFGLVREITLAYFYGASNVSDAYLISITIPSMIFGFIAIGLVVEYIPMYSKINQNDGELEANRYTNNLINILMVLCTIIIIISFFFTNQIIKAFAPGFEKDTLSFSAQLTKINLLAIYFIGIVSVFSGYLQLKGNYFIVSLMGLPFNIFVIISIILSTMTNILILSIGYVIAVAFKVVLMVPFIHKKGYRHKLVLNIKDKYIIKMTYISLPVILGISVDNINLLIDRTLASKIAIGGISALNYANMINGFVQGICVLSIATVLYPLMSKMAAENNMIGLKNYLSEAIIGINLLVIPATVVAMVFSAPIVMILFGRGAFDSDSIYMTSHATFYYSLGMVGVGLREIFARVFYSMQDTKTPMINASIGMLLNIILNIILSKYFGIAGLALATSIAAIITAVLMFISLKKKIGPFGMKQISISFLKILFASLVMGAISKLSFDYLTDNVLSQNLSFIVSIIVGAITYFIMICYMKIGDVDVIVDAIKRKMKKSTE
ncbi:murein biosynthesis integral membrane protein MurJ [Clostridium sediminicola]|uniref:murein biosynthesis integral membrane protein MurJ n=1 Tax=Clostridium sediminicola TaxID=3114879 RepID=UPI0031F1F2C8